MAECPKPEKWPRMNPKRSSDPPESSKEIVRIRSKGFCEAPLPGCPKIATEFHHKKKRSQGGSHTPLNLLHVTRHCHQMIEDRRPGTAGYRTLRWQKEGQSEMDTWPKEEF